VRWQPATHCGLPQCSTGCPYPAAARAVCAGRIYHVGTDCRDTLDEPCCVFAVAGVASEPRLRRWVLAIGNAAAGPGCRLDHSPRQERDRPHRSLPTSTIGPDRIGQGCRLDGTTHACWCGAMRAKAEWICFVDVDVRAAPRLVATAVAAADEQSVHLLSLSPFQELGSFWERLIVPVGLVLIACAMDLRQINDPAAPDVSASGQFMLFRRDAYFAVSGHAAVRGEICEDKALAARIKQAGIRFRLVGGGRLARTRMYTDLPSLWEGFSKNAVEILGNAAATVTLAMAGLIFSWTALALPVWSALVLAGDPFAPVVLGSGLCVAGSLAILGVHLGTVWHCRIPLWFGLLFPASYTAVVILAWSSLVLRRTGRVKWKGRTYSVVGKDEPGPLRDPVPTERASFRSTGAPPGTSPSKGGAGKPVTPFLPNR
jgi:chlorobactene glucosyltransferase